MFSDIVFVQKTNIEYLKNESFAYLLVYFSGTFDLISGERFVDASFWLSDLVRQTRSGYVRRIRIKIGIN